jgi:hypothetical protein
MERQELLSSPEYQLMTLKYNIMENLEEKTKGNNANIVLEYIICENCNKMVIKGTATKVPECYFKGSKLFYVCNYDCLKEFLCSFR